jgi:DNA-binding response OmpR family regulator
MPGESILIVDDTPVSLKLTDIVLRKEGFQVHTARNAEEALSLLRGFHPDVMLVDVHLPGMDGLELARCVKADPSTRDIVVLALTASTSAAEREKVPAAGCEGYILQPVNTQTLGTTVRGYLDQQPKVQDGESSAPQIGGLSLAGPELESLRRRFLEEGALHGRQMLDSLGPAFDAREASRLLSRWVEAAGALGYSAISEAASEAEKLLDRPHPNAGALREALSNLLCAFFEPPEAATDSLPDFIASPLSGKRIALTAFDAEDAERLCAALNRVGARPRLFEAAESPDSGPVRDCAVVMVHVCPAIKGSDWVAPDSPASRKQSLILAGDRRQIMALDASVQLRAHDFLIDGWQPEEALMRCGLALAHAAGGRVSHAAAPAPHDVPQPLSGPPEIVIAEDDPIMCSLLRVTLESYGMNCVVAGDGPEALELIRKRRPDAAVLDITMPGMDGYLVLAALREEKLTVPVVLLTARNHENDISRGFTLGADDYLVKPFNAVELVARLKRLFRR